MNLEVTLEDLERWKIDSLDLGDRLGYDAELLKMLRDESGLSIDKESNPSPESWYGSIESCSCCGKTVVNVLQRNLASLPVEKRTRLLRSIIMLSKLPEEKGKRIEELFAPISERVFYEVFNQSGMDYFLIGGLYYLLEKDRAGVEISDSKEVVRQSILVQERFARARAEIYNNKTWETFSKVLPVFFGYKHRIPDLMTRDLD